MMQNNTTVKFLGENTLRDLMKDLSSVNRDISATTPSKDSLNKFIHEVNSIRNAQIQDMYDQAFEKINIIKKNSFKQDCVMEKIIKRLNNNSAAVEKINVSHDSTNINVISSSQDQIYKINYWEYINHPEKMENLNILKVLKNFDQNKSVLENPEVSSDIGSILGDLGNMTIGEVITNTSEYLQPLIEFYQGNSTMIEIGGNIITPLLIIRGLVSLFNKTIDTHLEPEVYKAINEPKSIKGPLSSSILSDIREIRKVKLTFLLVGAPMIATYLLVVNNIYKKPPVTINLPNKNEISKSLIPFLFKNTNNKDQIPRKWKWVGYILIVIYALIKTFYIDKNIPFLGIDLNDPIFLKWMTMISIIIMSLFTIYLFLNIIIFILFSKNKIQMPKHFPSFVLKKLESLHTLSKIENKSIIIDFYLKYIFYSIIFILLGFLLLYII